MPIFFQQAIDDDTKLGVWKIEEEEAFFLQEVMPQRNVSHPHKKLQHLAGRYLLKYLFPDFPVALIQIADTRKPFLENEAYHFSISHCGGYAAAIVSKTKRVGIDIEIPTPKVLKIMKKFLHPLELQQVNAWNTASANSQSANDYRLTTLLWCAKEAMFKWWGRGEVDFSEMLRLQGSLPGEEGRLQGTFLKNETTASFPVFYKSFDDVLLAYVHTDAEVFQQPLFNQ